jgi:catechol 2,3-dioxygenase-like lactoylglutathione lyase family enzyme
MLNIKQLDHVVLRVANLAAMKRFYCEVLGCTVERERDDLGLHQLRAGAALIDLVPVDGPLGRKGGAAPGAEGRNLDHFCLQIADFDVDGVRAHLQTHGVDPGDEGPAVRGQGRGDLDLSGRP